MAKEYDTPEDAAAALQAIVRKNPLSEKFEFSSVIYQDPKTKKYRFTELQSNNKRGDVSITVRIPKGSMRGIFHNHPRHKNINEKQDEIVQRTHSPQDVETSKQFGVPSYIDVNNDLLVYGPDNPGRTIKIKRTGGGKADRVRAVEGEPVLAKIPMDQLRGRRTSKVLVSKADQEGMRTFGLDPKNAQHAKEWMANKK